MATIVLKEKCYIGDCPPKAAEKIKKLLTVPNPAFQTKIDLGLSLWNTKATLTFYEEENNILKIPIGATAAALEIIENIDQIVDMRYSHPAITNIKFTGKLRPYQQDAVDVLSSKTVGVLEAMTGSGKTIIACALIAKMQQPTLILVNTVDLAKQFRAKLYEFTDIKKVGFIGDGHFELGPVTVGLLQSVTTLTPREYETLNYFFGMVIVDEVHVIPAATFYSAINRLEAKYKFGLSATPKRTDGLSSIIFYAVGPKVHIIPIEELKGVLIPIRYIPIQTKYDFPLIETSEYLVMITDLSKDTQRNEFIADTYLHYQNEKGKAKSGVLLCTRKEQMYLLQKLLPGSKVLTSEVPKKKREQMIQDFTNGIFPTMISSYQLFATGIDVPRLEIVAFAAPMRSEILARQAAGRLMRSHSQPKDPIILDFVDKVGLLKGQAQARKRIITQIKV